MSQEKAGYDIGPQRTYHPEMNGAKDRHTAWDMLARLHEEARNLLEEAAMLRERLSPLLSAEPDRPDVDDRTIPPAASKLSAELGEVWLVVQQARDIVRTTQRQLDV